MLLMCSQAIASDIRRVVTGLDADNKSVAMFDSRVTLAPLQNDIDLANLWVTDSYPAGFSFKADTTGKSVGISPPGNGTQFGVVEFPPLDPAKTMQPLWHRTRTVDYVVVISGEIDLMGNKFGGAPQGRRYRRPAGDQPHLRVNRGKESCRLLFVVMDAKQP